MFATLRLWRYELALSPFAATTAHEAIRARVESLGQHSRGGGSAYTRASAIYDRLFAAPPEAMYPTLIAESEKARREPETA